LVPQEHRPLQTGYYFNLFFISLLTSALLCVSITFFLVDARAAAAIVGDLDALVNMESLTLETFNAGRNEVFSVVPSLLLYS
jgi:hypothetical protein